MLSRMQRVVTLGVATASLMLAPPLAYAVAHGSTPAITRPLRVVVEIDPGDQGTAKFRCHFHSVSGPSGHTFVFTHCKRGLS